MPCPIATIRRIRPLSGKLKEFLVATATSSASAPPAGRRLTRDVAFNCSAAARNRAWPAAAAWRRAPAPHPLPPLGLYAHGADAHTLPGLRDALLRRIPRMAVRVEAPAVLARSRVLTTGPRIVPGGSQMWSRFPRRHNTLIAVSIACTSLSALSSVSRSVVPRCNRRGGLIRSPGEMCTNRRSFSCE